MVKSGETKTIRIPITAQSLAMYDKHYNYVVEPGEFTIMTGNSSADKDLKKTTISVKNGFTIDKAK